MGYLKMANRINCGSTLNTAWLRTQSIQIIVGRDQLECSNKMI